MGLDITDQALWMNVPGCHVDTDPEGDVPIQTMIIGNGRSSE